jgi:acyl-CoA synthetase (AMP-forming)/AMP-acid ligase II
MPIRSPHPDVEVPDVTLSDFVLAEAVARGERPAIVDAVSGAVLTYAQLAQDVDRCAAGLAERGLATVDEGGRFRVVDRLKELIKYKGYQVPPAQLEGILLMHPQIADACVVPVRDEEAGEVPKAFVVPREGQALDPREVMAFVAGRVAPHMQVRACELIDAIPKSPSGKLLRRVLVEREREATQ